MSEPEDISPQVLSLARRLDRLPPGEYVIRLEKTPEREEPWAAEIGRVDSFWRGDVPRREGPPS